MRYVSLFSGIEAATVAWSHLGWEPLAFAEVDEFPAAVLAHRFPNVPNLGDVCKIDWEEFNDKYGAVDVLIGGSPCFPAGSLVLCESGFKPIEQVEVGDMVVTHKGRLREVLRTGNKTADTIVLKGQGSVGIECTPNHPFYSREKHKVWNNERREYLMTYDDSSEWRDASDMEGKFWLNVCNVEPSPIPRFATCGKGERGKGYIEHFEFTPEFFYFVGRWLGDGWANAHKRNGRKDSWMKRVYVCCSHGEADDLKAKLDETGLHFLMADNGSTVRFTCSSTQLHDWIVGNFGVHADGKNIPAWCFGMDWALRREMLQGYLDADGTKVENGNKSTTINRKLSLGVKMLAGTLGIATSVTLNKNNRKAVIDGREVNERPNYVSSHYTNYRSAFFADCGFYGLVRKVEEGRENITVYNLEVADDNSYTVDAVAVHNCQSFSIAGDREGLQGASKLMFEYVRAVRDLVRVSGGKSPRYIVWENVPGCLSSNKGRDFGCLLDELEDCGMFVCWRTLDSQFARVLRRESGRQYGPVPQRRRRVYLVGSLGGPSAAEILFERTCLRGDHPKGRAAREALTGGSAISAGMGDCAGFKWYQGARAGSIGYSDGQSPTLAVSDSHVPAVLTPWDVQSKRVNTPEGTSPTLPSGTGEGMNIQPIVMTTANTNANGRNISDEGVSYTIDGTNSNAVAFAQNTRDEVRLFGGDGSTVGAVSAQPGIKQQSFVCMQDGQAKGGISEDVSTTLNSSHEQPIIIDRAAFNQGENAKYDPHIEEGGVMDALVARGPHAVCHRTETK